MRHHMRLIHEFHAIIKGRFPNLNNFVTLIADIFLISVILYMFYFHEVRTHFRGHLCDANQHSHGVKDGYDFNRNMFSSNSSTITKDMTTP